MPAVIVMPDDAPKVKRDSTLALGAEVVGCNRFTDSREKIAAHLAHARGAVLVPSFDDAWVIEAPAVVFESQQALLDAFAAGELERDFVAVLRFQGPRANGMPELHKLTPPLSVLQGRGFRVALVTDGRMSGASGNVPAAIHVSPEAAMGGALARVRDGDVVRVDALAGTLQALVSQAEWDARTPAQLPAALQAANGIGMGRELFAGMRRNTLSAEEGACSWL
jgi:phosphogluconate dehydratase